MNMSDFKGDKAYKMAFYVLLGVLGIIALFIIYGLVVKLLWNATIASLFQVSVISFWQAIGLVLLAKMFFGFGPGPKPPRRRSRRKGKEGDLPSSRDKDFRDYWDNEGKAAYNLYIEGRQSRQDDEDERT